MSVPDLFLCKGEVMWCSLQVKEDSPKWKEIQAVYQYRKTTKHKCLFVSKNCMSSASKMNSVCALLLHHILPALGPSPYQLKPIDVGLLTYWHLGNGLEDLSCLNRPQWSNGIWFPLPMGPDDIASNTIGASVTTETTNSCQQISVLDLHVPVASSLGCPSLDHFG